MTLTILMPCLNEENSIGFCIDEANNFLKKHNINGEILIVDNGSADSSKDIALNKNVRVIDEHNKGYGSALRTGILNALGKYTIMLDCDGSYDFNDIENILNKLNEGYDFVCGNRFKGGIDRDAMPLSHRLGVPILSYIGKKRYNIPINDFHCGLRGFKTELAQSVNFNTTGMEFATEIIYRFKDSKMIEVPVKLHKDIRGKKSHLRTIPDGIRHLKFILKD